MPRDREDPHCFDMLALERAPVEAPGVLDGLRGAPLTSDRRTGAASLLVELPPGWKAGCDGRGGDLELFVLSGDLGFEGEQAGSGAYLHVPERSAGGELSSRTGGLALAFWNPLLPAYPPPFTMPRLVRSWAEPWHPTLPGAHGVMHRSLRLPDPQTDTFDGGPGGFVRMFFLAPGIADPAQHVHHECWEEVITLSGDVLMADQGLTAVGTVLSNPQEHWHGPFASHSGAVLLVQSNGPMGAPWPHREYPEGEGLIAGYLDRSPWLVPPVHTDWDACPESKRDDAAFAAWREQNPRYGTDVGRDAAWDHRAGRGAPQ